MIFVRPVLKKQESPDTPWVHLWRMIDIIGSTAPDSGSVGGAPLTLTNASSVASGAQIDSVSGRLHAPKANLWKDLGVGIERYTFVMEITANTEGHAGFGRFWTLHNQDAIEIYFRDNSLGARVKQEPTSHETVDLVWGGNSYPQKICLVMPRGEVPRIIYVYRDGTRILRYQNSDINLSTLAPVSAPNLILGNRAALDRGANGVIHWAGFLDYAVDDAEADQIAADGRP